jgi:hypothetical protein
MAWARGVFMAGSCQILAGRFISAHFAAMMRIRHAPERKRQ